MGRSPLEGVAKNAEGGWSEGKTFPSLNVIILTGALNAIQDFRNK